MTTSVARPAGALEFGGDARRGAFVLTVAALTGALTPLGEHLLPRSINSAANSSGPWATITFASIYVTRIRGWRAALLGATSFVVMDAFFYVFFELLGGVYPHHNLAFWVGVALVIGPLVGLCAAWLRSRRSLLRVVAVAAPTAILIGEGVFMLVRLPGDSTLYAVASVVVGLVLFGILARLRLPTFALRALSLVTCAAGSVAFFAVYGLLPGILGKVVP
ncbi:MAG: DUF6518 family protein [Galbitalea sp.]